MSLCPIGGPTSETAHNALWHCSVDSNMMLAVGVVLSATVASAALYTYEQQ